MINVQDLRATDLLRILENISSVSVNQLGSRIATLNNDERTAYLDDIASRILDIVKQNFVQIEEMTSSIKCESILKKYYKVITRHEASVDVTFSISNSKSFNNLFSSKFPSTRDRILDNEITKNLEPYFHQALQQWVEDEDGEMPGDREFREIVASKMKEVYAESKTSLDLSHFLLTSLPAVIGCLNSLECLDLQRNRLTALPSEIGCLINLQKLNLHMNNLETLPKEIEHLKKLQDLNLSRNNFVIFPRLLCNITTLKHLEVGGNRLTALPLEIKNLKNLTYLNLFGNALKVLPSVVGTLSALSHLVIGDNPITSLWPEIGNLEHLEVLDLYNAPLTSLPAEMGKLTNLKKLYVYNNVFETLPRSLGACRKLDKISSGRNDEILSEDLANQACEIHSVCKAGDYPKWTINKAVSRNEDNLDLTYASSDFTSKSLDIFVCKKSYFQKNLKALCLPTLMLNQLPSSIMKLTNITILSFK